MRKYILDSGIAEEQMRGNPKVVARARAEVAAGSRIGICVPILGELIYGIENGSSAAANRQRLQIALARWRVWPYTTAAAEEFGRLRARLRRAGRKMQVIDLQLAAVALTLGDCTVVSSDSDLLAVPGLAVENWAA